MRRKTYSTFECLKQCLDLNKLTRGAFNIAYENFILTPDEYLFLNEDEMSIEMLKDNIKIDLGAFGKGYAVDITERILKEWGIDNVLIHGGFSSVKAVGVPTALNGWQVSISNPNNSSQIISQFALKDFSISGSGIKKGIHIIDPLTKQPVMNKTGTWALSKSAAVSDALSTAFIILDNNIIKEICDENEDIYALALTGNEFITKDDIFVAGKPGMFNILV
jgi:thiamine biosynthesis lipoprotein